mmetsp:Transcript_43302/g.80481  ORF Transcript_43302/g.80481 Transcript_43302/m.80481 type:complete len:358 (+) Transcript_43302:2-1075(+)
MSSMSPPVMRDPKIKDRMSDSPPSRSLIISSILVSMHVSQLSAAPSSPPRPSMHVPTASTSGWHSGARKSNDAVGSLKKSPPSPMEGGGTSTTPPSQFKSQPMSLSATQVWTSVTRRAQEGMHSPMAHVAISMMLQGVGRPSPSPGRPRTEASSCMHAMAFCTSSWFSPSTHVISSSPTSRQPSGSMLMSGRIGGTPAPSEGDWGGPVTGVSTAGDSAAQSTAQSLTMPSVPSATQLHRSMTSSAQGGQHSIMAHTTFVISPCAAAHVPGSAEGIAGATKASSKHVHPWAVVKHVAADATTPSSLHLAGSLPRKGRKSLALKPASTRKEDGGRTSGAVATARRMPLAPRLSWDDMIS